MQAPLTAANIPEVLQCLQAALQPSGEVQKQAEGRLAALEQRQGFCSCLAAIMLNREADHSARWLASVQLKNTIIKHWRARPDPRSITAEEKAHMRSVLPQLIVQDDNQVAVQVALVWAKVARQDYPGDWPSLFNDLLALLSTQNASQLAIRRTLLVIHHTVKELATKRLAADQKNFAQAAALLFAPIWQQWCADTTGLLANLPAVLSEDPPPPQGAAQQLLVTLERWLMLLKVLRRLLVFGHISDHKSLQPVQEVSICAPVMMQALQQLVALRPGGGSRSSHSHMTAGGGMRGQQRHQTIVMLERGLLKLAKVLVALQDVYPWSFHACGALLQMLSHSCNQLITHQSHGGGMAAASSAWDRYLIQCMAFIMNTLRCDAYRGKLPGGDALTDHEQDAPRVVLVSEVKAVLGGWWTANHLTNLTRALVNSYCRLTVRDIEEWTTNSEAFYHDADVSGWQEHVGVAAEALYLLLIQNNREVLAPLLVSMLQETSAACPLNVLVQHPEQLPGGMLAVPGTPLHVPSAMLALEAVLGATARGAYELHDYLEFTPWLHNNLLPILNTQGPVLRVLRWRVLRVIAACVARLQANDRPAVYAAVLACMAEDDACMQLTSVSCLHSLIDDWNFNEQQFEQYVGPSMQLLLRILASASELDSQSQAFNLMNLIIERMGDLIRPWVEPLAGLLPELWKAAEGQSLLRIQVLLALQRLVQVLGMQSHTLYPILLPLLHYSTDPQETEALQLMEDGLGLWLVVVCNAPSLHAPLLALLPHVPKLLAGSTEHCAICMALLASIALLAREHLQVYAQDVNNAYEVLVGNVNERGMLLLLPSLEAVINACPAITPHMRPALLKMLQLLLAGQESAQVLAASCCALARLLLSVPQEVQVLLSSLGTDVNAALARLVELWTEHFDALASPRQRKLSALGLCVLLARMPCPAVIGKLDEMLVCITGAWADLEAGAPQAGGDDSARTWAMWADDDSGNEAVLSVAVASEDAEGETQRRQQLRATDPLSTSSLRDVLRGALEAARAACGPALDAALQALDPHISSQLQGMISGTHKAAVSDML